MATKKKNKKKKQTKSKNSNQAVRQQNNETVKQEQAVHQEKKEIAKAEKKTKEAKKNTKPKKAKPNIFVRMINFCKEVVVELKKVSWLSTDELMKSTGVVAGIVAIFTFMTWIVDTGLGALAAALIGSK
ncbi:MAG: preprotein translocase subunit SecE [Eubacteriaceae bacterium]|nr:preprotein translocase subunit SecE [Eubacteriaceae bacterium]